jgi:Family of unknown function (DUF6580)
MFKIINNSLYLKVILGLMGVVVLSRLLPHEPNFVPVAAIALFAGTYIQDKKLALIMVMSVLLFSDIMLELFYGNGFYGTMIFVYGSVALIATIGFWLRGRVQRQTIMVASLTGSILFYLITNFGVWLVDGMYPLTTDGLIASYVAAIPFFRGTLLGDLFYNLVLFGSFALIRLRYPKFVKG